MLKSVVLLAAIAAVAQASPTTQCIHHTGFELPINSYIIGCQTPPCLLPQQDYVVINIVFRAPRTMRSMQTLATALLYVSPITVLVPFLLQENAVTCNFLQNSSCPVEEDEVLQYELRMFIEDVNWVLPVNAQAAIEFRVVDENWAPVFCLRVDVRIVDPVDGVSGRNATVVEIA